MTELHVSHDSERFEGIRAWNGPAFLLYEGKSFWHFDDRWATDGSGYVVPYERARERPDLFRVSRYFRLSFREVASSTNERTAVFSMLPPNVLTVHTAPSELQPERRSNAVALRLLSVANSFSFDFATRINATGHMSLFILDRLPLPILLGDAASCVSRAALRLTCNHAGYEPLWHEQLGDVWREPGEAPFTWPVLAGDDERWAVRAVIDAVVADAYGLSREQYAHVLSTFSHASYKKAPDLCLAAFDELKAIGLDAFCKKHDPYHDIPLVETLPKPVIDLPIPDTQDAPAEGSTRGRRRRRSRTDTDGSPTLWQERNGRLTLEPPGPLFDPPPRTRPAPAAPDPGKVQAVRTLLELRKVLTSADVQQQFDLDPASARAILKQLADKGLAVVEGKAKGTKYRLVQKAT